MKEEEIVKQGALLEKSRLELDEILSTQEQEIVKQGQKLQERQQEHVELQYKLKEVQDKEFEEVKQGNYFIGIWKRTKCS